MYNDELTKAFAVDLSRMGYVVYSNKYSLPSNDIFAVIDIAGGMLTFGKASPTNPKCLILHGDSDTTVSLKDSREFEEKLGKAEVLLWSLSP